MRSASGLTGRPAVRPPTPPRQEAWDGPPAPGPSLPSPCLRRMALGDRADECRPDCPGYQDGGGCLADLTRAAGVPLAVSVDAVGYWHVEEG